MNAIEVDNVSKRFRLGALGIDLREKFGGMFRRNAPEPPSKDFWALRDITFNVEQGESFGIIGHNGSGKSTLLKLITGIYTPTLGTFTTRGRISALIEVGAGFHPDLTGRENIYMNGSVLGMKRKEIERRFDDIVAFSELEQFIDTPVKRYSSGMFMRLGFAVAAHVDPDIVLVDEVLAVGDESFQAKCMRKMQDLRRNGKTIVFISHSMDAITALCSRVMLLSHGKILAAGNPRDVISVYRTSLSEDLVKRANMRKKIGDPEETFQKKMTVREVRALDQYGQPCESIGLGDPLILECSFHASIPVERPAFGVMVHRADDVYIYGFNTKFDEVEVPRAEGDHVFRVVFDHLPMMQGLYYFSVLLFELDENNAHHEVDAYSKAASVIIRSDNLNHGLVELSHTWQPHETDSSPAASPALAEIA